MASITIDINVMYGNILSIQTYSYNFTYRARWTQLLQASSQQPPSSVQMMTCSIETWISLLQNNMKYNVQIEVYIIYNSIVISHHWWALNGIAMEKSYIFNCDQAYLQEPQNPLYFFSLMAYYSFESKVYQQYLMYTVYCCIHVYNIFIATSAYFKFPAGQKSASEALLDKAHQSS